MTDELGTAFGTLAGGRPVRRYTVGADNGLTLRVLDLGATVQELWVPDGAGERVNVVLGGAHAADYGRSPTDFFGAVIGRVANRVAKAEFELGGRRFSLARNDGPHHLHGGPQGFHTRTWAVVDHGPDLITLELVSPDGDQGYPGTLTARVTYEVVGLSVEITMSATTDQATPVALTQHAHFNLGGEGSGSVDRHLLAVTASRCTPVDDALIPTGVLEKVGGGALDLRSPRLIGDVVRAPHPQIARGRGLDLNYVLDQPVFGGDAAVLSDPGSGRVLKVRTDQPGLQVYTGNFFTGQAVGTGGTAYRQGDGVALEAQAFPDSVHKHAEDWTDIVLAPGDEYRARTTWDFSQSHVQHLETNWC